MIALAIVVLFAANGCQAYIGSVRMSVSLKSYNFEGILHAAGTYSPRFKDCIINELFYGIQIQDISRRDSVHTTYRNGYFGLCSSINAIHIDIIVKDYGATIDCSDFIQNGCVMRCQAYIVKAYVNDALIRLLYVRPTFDCSFELQYSYRPANRGHKSLGVELPDQTSSFQRTIPTHSPVTLLPVSPRRVKSTSTNTEAPSTLIPVSPRRVKSASISNQLLSTSSPLTTRGVMLTSTNNQTLSTYSLMTTLGVKLTPRNKLGGTDSIDLSEKTKHITPGYTQSAIILGLVFGLIVLIVSIVVFIYIIRYKIKLLTKQPAEGFCIADHSEVINTNRHGAPCSTHVYRTPYGEWDTEGENGHRHRDMYALPVIEDNYSFRPYERPDIIKEQSHAEGYRNQHDYIEIMDHYSSINQTEKRVAKYENIETIK